MPPSADDLEFIAGVTRLRSPKTVPEIALHLADDLDVIWTDAQQRSGCVDEPIPFWAFAWAGGLAVSRYLLDHPGAVSGKRVLDIGTGSGLCAIAAKLAGAASVCAADIDPLCGAAVRLNATANDVEVRFVERDLLAEALPEVDLIVAGDIGYEASLARSMLDRLAVAHRNGAGVLIGDPERRYFPHGEMRLLACFEIETTLELENSTRKRTGVYTFPDRA